MAAATVPMSATVADRLRRGRFAGSVQATRPAAVSSSSDCEMPRGPLPPAIHESDRSGNDCRHNAWSGRETLRGCSPLCRRRRSRCVSIDTGGTLQLIEVRLKHEIGNLELFDLLGLIGDLKLKSLPCGVVPALGESS